MMDKAMSHEHKEHKEEHKEWAQRRTLVKLRYTLTKKLMFCLISVSLLSNKFAISVITIASTTACLQEKLFGVLNFAPFNLTGWTKDQSSILGIELDTINTLFLSPASVLPFDLMTKVFSFFRYFFESIVQRLNQGFCYKAESRPHNAGIQGLIIRILLLTIQRPFFRILLLSFALWVRKRLVQRLWFGILLRHYIYFLLHYFFLFLSCNTLEA